MLNSITPSVIASMHFKSVLGTGIVKGHFKDYNDCTELKNMRGWM